MRSRGTIILVCAYFGPGPNTAVLSGFGYWIIGYALPPVGIGQTGLFPVRVLKPRIRSMEDSKRKAIISFVLALIASVLSLLVPLYMQETRLQRFLEPSTFKVMHETVLGVNGPMVLYLVAVPVIVAGAPILLSFRAVRMISAILLTSCVVVGAASIGMFYIPSAVAMFGAVRKKPA
jgi:hypothetical protein